MVAATTSSISAMRPEAKTFRIEDLVRHARSGKVRVPPFQRAFKWEREDVEKLFDSIWHGYPIGTLLLWAKAAPAAHVSLGALELDVGEVPTAWWVVDGQQRIVSLASVLVPVERKDPKFQLYFDLKEGRVAHASGRGRPPTTFLPLDRVVDSEELLSWLDANRTEISSDELKLAVRVGKIIREYEVPAYVVDVADEKVVREIFDRTNSSGKPLESSEVFDGLHASWNPHPPASLAEVVNRLARFSFGTLDRELVLRSLLAIEGKDIAGNFRDELEGLDIPDAVSRTEIALQRVLAFLVQDAAIPHLKLLPYKNPLITLSIFFDQFPNPSTRSRRLLMRWLWRGAITEEHQGGTAVTRKTLKLVAEAAGDEAAAQALLRSLTTPRPNFETAAPFNFRYARSKLIAIALVELGPRNLTSDEPVPLSEMLADDEDQIPHLTSKRPHTPDQQRLVQSVGNRILHPTTTGGSFLDLVRASQHTDALRSHGIDAAAHKLLVAGDVWSFLERRLQLIETRARALFDARAEWEHPDRLSIDAILAG